MRRFELSNRRIALPPAAEGTSPEGEHFARHRGGGQRRRGVGWVDFAAVLAVVSFINVAAHLLFTEIPSAVINNSRSRGCVSYDVGGPGRENSQSEGASCGASETTRRSNASASGAAVISAEVPGSVLSASRESASHSSPGAGKKEENITVGIVVTVTGCDGFPPDGAAVLHHSIVRQPLRYRYYFYAVYHPSARECAETLADLNFTLLERQSPVTPEEIRGEVLRNTIARGGAYPGGSST
jgi:hypothetical protein